MFDASCVYLLICSFLCFSHGGTRRISIWYSSVWLKDERSVCTCIQHIVLYILYANLLFCVKGFVEFSLISLLILSLLASSINSFHNVFLIYMFILYHASLFRLSSDGQDFFTSYDEVYETFDGMATSFIYIDICMYLYIHIYMCVYIYVYMNYPFSSLTLSFFMQTVLVQLLQIYLNYPLRFLCFLPTC